MQLLKVQIYGSFVKRRHFIYRFANLSEAWLLLDVRRVRSGDARSSKRNRGAVSLTGEDQIMRL